MPLMCVCSTQPNVITKSTICGEAGWKDCSFFKYQLNVEAEPKATIKPGQVGKLLCFRLVRQKPAELRVVERAETDAKIGSRISGRGADAAIRAKPGVSIKKTAFIFRNQLPARLEFGNLNRNAEYICEHSFEAFG